MRSQLVAQFIAAICHLALLTVAARSDAGCAHVRIPLPICHDDRLEVAAEANLQLSATEDWHRAEVDLKSLEAGKSYRIKLAVQNPSQHPIEFVRFDFNCRCLTLESPLEPIPAGHSREWVFLLNTPRRASKILALHQIRLLRSDGNVAAEISVKYELANMFAVTQSQVKLEVPYGQAFTTTRVPLVITPPMELKNLELIVAKPLQGLRIEWADDHEGPGVIVSATREALGAGTLAGSVSVRQRGTDDSDGFFLTVGLGRKLTIQPDLLRLTPNADGTRLAGEAFLKIAPGVEVPRDTPLTASATVGEQEADVRIEQRNESSVYRMRLQCPLPATDSAGKSLVVIWRVRLGTETEEIRTLAIEDIPQPPFGGEDSPLP
jgi:hypothetical protein